MMLPDVVPEAAGDVIPVGTAPETSFQLFCVGVTPPSARVLQPVVSNQTTLLRSLSARCDGPAGGVITQVPLGPVGAVGGVVVGVHPLRVTLTMFDLLSCTTTRQSGAVNPDAWILNFPSRKTRVPAAEVEERAAMKPAA